MNDHGGRSAADGVGDVGDYGQNDAGIPLNFIVEVRHDLHREGVGTSGENDHVGQPHEIKSIARGAGKGKVHHQFIGVAGAGQSKISGPGPEFIGIGDVGRNTDAGRFQHGDGHIGKG